MIFLRRCVSFLFGAKPMYLQAWSFSNTDTDALEGRQMAEFGQAYVVEVLHTYRPLVRAIGAAVADFDPNAGLLQLRDGFVGEASALVAPEADAYGEFSR